MRKSVHAETSGRIVYREAERSQNTSQSSLLILTAYSREPVEDSDAVQGEGQ